MDKKEIIYQLASNIQLNELVPAVRYGAIRRKIKANGISEIAFYSAVADHLIENDIHPTRFVKDTARILEEIAENPFVLKTDDTFFFLGQQFENIKLSGLDDKKFLCNKCFLVKSKSEIAGHKNYPNTCRKCVNEMTAARARQNSKKKREIKSAKPVPKQEPPKEYIVEVDQSDFINNEAVIMTEPYLEVESILGEKGYAAVTVKLPVTKIPEFFQTIQPAIKEIQEETQQETTEE